MPPFTLIGHYRTSTVGRAVGVKRQFPNPGSKVNGAAPAVGHIRLLPWVIGHQRGPWQIVLLCLLVVDKDKTK